MRIAIWTTTALVTLGLSTFLITATDAQEVSLSGQFVTEPVRGVELSWVAPADMRIAVQRRLGDSFVTVGPFTRTRFQVYDTNVTAQQTYTYRLKVIDPVTDEEYFSNTVSVLIDDTRGGDSDDPVNPPVTVPRAPIDITTEFIEEPLRAVRLSWTDQSDNETSFTLERSSDGEWTALDSLQANQRSAFDAEVEPGATYRYRVRAENSAGVSAYVTSDEISIPGTSVTEPPTNPESLQAVVDGYTVVLVWDDVEGEDEFVIERRVRGPEDSGFSDFALIGSVEENQLRFIDSDIAERSRYIYRIVARNEFGDSRYSPLTRTRTGSFVPNKPVRPSIVADAKVPTTVTLSWSAVSTAEYYLVQRRQQSGRIGWGDFEIIGQTRSGLQEYVDSIEEGGLSYQYQVQAVNDYGESAWSQVARIAIPSYSPEQSTELTASLTESIPAQARLQWGNAQRATGYIVERRDSRFGEYVQVARVDTPSWTDTNLESDQRYWYRVVSYNQHGEAKASRAVAIRTPSFAPDRPDRPALTVGSNRNTATVDVRWQPVETATGYVIERRSGIFDFTYEDYATVGEQTLFTDTEVEQGGRYYYRIRAYNQYDQSQSSRAQGVRIR